MIETLDLVSYKLMLHMFMNGNPIQSHTNAEALKNRDACSCFCW
jgi:hypothetical protein